MSTYKFEAVAKLVEKFTVNAKVRDFEFVADEPQELGGADKGPNPIEYLLASLASCLLIALNFHALKGGIKIRSAEARASGKLDIRGFMGEADVRPGLQEIALEVEVESEASREEVEKLIKYVEEHCPVADTLGKGTRLITSFRVRSSSCGCS